MRWFRLVSLRLQIVLAVLAFTLAVGLGNTLRTHLALDALAREQFEERSAATAVALAAQATDPILTNDLFGLYELINDTLVNTPEARYVVVLDQAGAVRAHTFGSGVPVGLVEANPNPVHQRWKVRRLSTEEGTIVDVAVPLLDGQAGTLRLGMRERTITAMVRRHAMNLLALTLVSLLPVLALTYVLGRAITRPLLELVEVTKAIGQGDLSGQASVEGRDEVAQLGIAFNAMTRDLARSQEALESSNRALQQRNEELAALFAVATSTARTAHADSVVSLVQAALDTALDVLGLRAGWVLLEDNRKKGGWAPCATRGIPPETVLGMASQEPPSCITGGTHGMRAAVVAHAGAACPWLAGCDPGLQDLCHAVVPLRTRGRVWGIMNLACPDPECFSASRMGLLTAIGRQVGIAIENTHLAQDRQREAVRRRLLDQVMAAQEEERKRIARELHDELAQSLIVLIRDIEGISDRALTNESPDSESIRDTRALALRILEQTRRLIFDLRPTALDDLGLLPAVRRYAQHHLDRAGMELCMEVSGDSRRLAPQVETVVFRIAQEAITNAVRHSGASRVNLSLRFDGDGVALTVADDGVGFDPDTILEAVDSTHRMGLLGMRERAELLGGQLHINARPSAGTNLRVEIPSERHEPNSRVVGG